MPRAAGDGDESRRASDVFDELFSTGELFHGWAEEVYRDWSLSPAALSLLYSTVGSARRTVETGCGYSTVAFALAGASHTVISPFALEHDRIRTWCRDRSISLENVVFIAERSQDVLPDLRGDPIDFVLIDGDHAFPVPFLDWYYTAERLRVGGSVMVDDTQIRTGALLREFLEMDTKRWRSVSSLPTTSLFQKLDPEVLDPSGWIGQPFCAPKSRRAGRRSVIRRVLSALSARATE